tara:strand:+ start:94 stop:270 length:177 start_codon:yes stop_codon:yes gene_type:complete
LKRHGKSILISLKNYLSPHLDMTTATYKSTALKVLVLWNLPALIVLTGALHVGKSVIA